MHNTKNTNIYSITISANAPFNWLSPPDYIVCVYVRAHLICNSFFPFIVMWIVRQRDIWVRSVCVAQRARVHGMIILFFIRTHTNIVVYTQYRLDRRLSFSFCCLLLWFNSSDYKTGRRNLFFFLRCLLLELTFWVELYLCYIQMSTNIDLYHFFLSKASCRFRSPLPSLPEQVPISMQQLCYFDRTSHGEMTNERFSLGSKQIYCAAYCKVLYI